MATEGWFSDWYANGWFPSVWFAPGDESHLTEEELQPVVVEEGMGYGGPKKKRKKREPYNDDEEVMMILCQLMSIQH
jgi:hypothetical protein